MEFSQLDTKSPQEEGAFLHLRHPKFGHLLWTGPDADSENRLDPEDGEGADAEPIGVTVRGLEAPSVKEEEEAGLRMAEILVIEFHGLTKGGEPVEATKENIREFFQLSDDLVQQVLTFARDKENFFLGTSKT